MINQYSRDNGRTPFQWDSTENAGFTTGVPWLKVNPNYVNINVAKQEKDPDSVLQYYRKLADIRSNPEFEDALIYGEVEPYLEEEPGLMAYFRRGEKQDFLVAGNFTKEEKRILGNDTKEAEVILTNDELMREDRELIIKPFQVVVLRFQKER